MNLVEKQKEFKKRVGFFLYAALRPPIYVITGADGRLKSFDCTACLRNNKQRQLWRRESREVRVGRADRHFEDNTRTIPLVDDPVALAQSDAIELVPIMNCEVGNNPTKDGDLLQEDADSLALLFTW